MWDGLEPVERHNDIFNLEYYWSPLLEVYENEYYGNSGWQNIYERRAGSNPHINNIT